jgi:hypothetical protein
MKRIRNLLLGAFLFLAPTLYAQNDKFKALFIYNFTNYIDWPAGSVSNSFVITVVGDSPIIEELQTIATKKKINNLPIVVKKVKDVASIGTPQIVFIPSDKRKWVADINRTSAGNPVLVISDNASGDFGINLIERDQKQMFQISKSNIESHHLKVSSSLLTLGIAID